MSRNVFHIGRSRCSLPCLLSFGTFRICRLKLQLKWSLTLGKHTHTHTRPPSNVDCEHSFLSVSCCVPGKGNTKKLRQKLRKSRAKGGKPQTATILIFSVSHSTSNRYPLGCQRQTVLLHTAMAFVIDFILRLVSGGKNQCSQTNEVV